MSETILSKQLYYFAKTIKANNLFIKLHHLQGKISGDDCELLLKVNQEFSECLKDLGSEYIEALVGVPLVPPQAMTPDLSK